MSDIKWTPDENGVPMCNNGLKEGERCEYDEAGLCHGPSLLTGDLMNDNTKHYCYAKIVKMVAALQGVEDWRKQNHGDNLDACFQDLKIMFATVREALHHE